jgi:hypothetical protein
LSKNAGSGSVLNQSGFTTLVLGYFDVGAKKIHECHAWFFSHNREEEEVVARARRIKQFAEFRCHSLGNNETDSAAAKCRRYTFSNSATSSAAPANDPIVVSFVRPADRLPDNERQIKSGDGGSGGDVWLPTIEEGGRGRQQQHRLDQLYETVRDIAASGGGGGERLIMSRSNTISFPSNSSSSSGTDHVSESR